MNILILHEDLVRKINSLLSNAYLSIFKDLFITIFSVFVSRKNDIYVSELMRQHLIIDIFIQIDLYQNQLKIEIDQIKELVKQ